MVDLIPVDHDPFAPPQLVPVDHDPWAQYIEPPSAGHRPMPTEARGDVPTAQEYLLSPAGHDQGMALAAKARGDIGEAQNALWGMTGVPDIQQGAQAWQRGEYLPALGQMAAGAAQFGSLAGPMARGAATLGREALGAVPGVMGDTAGTLRVWHASPHDFDQFDISKVGTGQGAASYGHGLYGAENPAVSGLGSQYDREFTAKNLGKPDLNQLEDFILQSIRSGKDTPGVMKDLAENHPYLSFDEAYNQYKRVNDAKAKIYDTQINADPEHFLDWDKPAAAQPENVKKALNALWEARGGSLEGREYPPFAAHHEATGQSLIAAIDTSFGGAGQASQALREAGVPGIRYQDQGSRYVLPKWSIDNEPLNHYPISNDPVVRGLQRVASHLSTSGGPRSIDEGIAQLKAMGSDAGDRAAELLAANRDRVSVSAPPATHNYVVFDDKLIDIIKKYGLAGLIAGGAATVGGSPAGATHLIPVDHDPFAGATP